MYEIQIKTESGWEDKVTATLPGLALAQVDAVKKYYKTEVRVWDIKRNRELPIPPEIWGPVSPVGGYFCSNGTNSITC